jgi:hypothetical protein
LGTALLIGLSRYTYFVWMPSQIFAPRYLPWSCMFWLGLVLATTACFHARWPRLVLASLTSLVLVAAAALGFSHLGWLQWAQETSRRADIMAMALSQGEILGDLDKLLAIPEMASTLRTVDMLTGAGHDVFGHSCPQRSVQKPSSPGRFLSVRWVDPQADMSSERLRRLYGEIAPAGSNELQLWIYSSEGLCIGRGSMTQHSNVIRQMLFGQRNLFDALVELHDPVQEVELQLFAADTLLDRLSLAGPPSQ